MGSSPPKGMRNGFRSFTTLKAPRISRLRCHHVRRSKTMEFLPLVYYIMQAQNAERRGT